MALVVPIKKKSKKSQKEYYSKLRGSWNGISPVTRTAPNGKKYNRKRIKRELRAKRELET